MTHTDQSSSFGRWRALHPSPPFLLLVVRLMNDYRIFFLLLQPKNFYVIFFEKFCTKFFPGGNRIFFGAISNVPIVILYKMVERGEYGEKDRFSVHEIQ